MTFTSSTLATLVGGVIAVGLVVGWIVQACIGHPVDPVYETLTGAAVGHFLSGVSATSTSAQTLTAVNTGAASVGTTPASTTTTPSGTVTLVPAPGTTGAPSTPTATSEAS